MAEASPAEHRSESKMSTIISGRKSFSRKKQEWTKLQPGHILNQGVLMSSHPYLLHYQIKVDTD